MKFPRKSFAVLGAVALISIGSAAYAGPPWTVSVGGSSSGSAATFTASTLEIDPAAGDQPDIEFSVPAADLTCDTGTADGTITPGATASTAGEISSTVFTDCLGPFGIALDVTQTCAWDLNIVGNNVSGVTPGEIDGVCAHVENPGGLCEFDVTGAVPGAFDESNQQLAVSGGGLTVSNVSGCFGAIGNGNAATFDGTYQLANIATVTIAN